MANYESESPTPRSVYYSLTRTHCAERHGHSWKPPLERPPAKFCVTAPFAYGCTHYCGIHARGRRAVPISECPVKGKE